MKLFKGIKVLGAACLLATVAFAQDKDYEVSFKNKLSTDTIDYVKAEGYAKDSATAFSGIKEKAEASYESEKLSFGVTGVWKFGAKKDVEDAVGTGKESIFCCRPSHASFGNGSFECRG